MKNKGVVSALRRFPFPHAVGEAKLPNVSEREQRELGEGDIPAMGI